MNKLNTNYIFTEGVVGCQRRGGLTRQLKDLLHSTAFNVLILISLSFFNRYECGLVKTVGQLYQQESIY